MLNCKYSPTTGTPTLSSCGADQEESHSGVPYETTTTTATTTTVSREGNIVILSSYSERNLHFSHEQNPLLRFSG